MNAQQQIDKDVASSDSDVKLDAELKKHPKNIYAKDMRYVSAGDAAFARYRGQHRFLRP